MTFNKDNFTPVDQTKRGKRSSRMYIRLSLFKTTVRCYVSKSAINTLLEGTEHNEWQLLVDKPNKTLAFQPITKKRPRANLGLFTCVEIYDLVKNQLGGKGKEEEIEIELTMDSGWLFGKIE